MSAKLSNFPGNVNRNLKWAFVEIGNLVVGSQEATWCGCINESNAAIKFRMKSSDNLREPTQRIVIRPHCLGDPFGSRWQKMSVI